MSALRPTADIGAGSSALLLLTRNGHALCLEFFWPNSDDPLKKAAEVGVLLPGKRPGTISKIRHFMSPKLLRERFQIVENQTGDRFKRVGPVWFVIINKNRFTAWPDACQKSVDDQFFVIVWQFVQ